MYDNVSVLVSYKRQKYKSEKKVLKSFLVTNNHHTGTSELVEKNKNVCFQKSNRIKP
jgi:hypothetical protein